MKAFLAMFLPCACWSFSGILMMASCVGVAAPHGLLVAPFLVLYTFVGFLSLFQFHHHLVMLSVPIALAARAPPSWGRFIAIVSLTYILILSWVAMGEEPWKPRPSVRQFVSEWGHKWFAETGFRSELPDGCTSKCCFSFHPHGIGCWGFCFNGALNPYFEKAGQVNWVIAYRLRYCIPPFRWFFDAAIQTDRRRVVDSERKTVKGFMEKGENFSIIPGGASEISTYAYGKDTVAMKNRQGLIKYCLQYGYKMYPVYTFGETTTYSSAMGWFRDLGLKVVGSTGMAPSLFWGWKWFGIMPRTDSRIITYMGDAVELPKIEEPTSEEIEEWLGKYVEALKKLFEEKKGEAGFPDAVLEFL